LGNWRSGNQTAGITPTRWRENHQKRGNDFQDKKDELRSKYPLAAQLTLDRDLAEQYYDQIGTAGGNIATTRTRQEQLLDGYFSIDLEAEMPYGAEESVAFTKFYADRDAYRDSLNGGDRQLLDQALNSFRTATEREYYADLRMMRPFWDAGREEFIDDLIRHVGRESEVREYFNSNKVKRQAMESAESFYGGLLNAWKGSRSSGSIQRSRNLMLRMSPSIGALLLKWEYRRELPKLESKIEAGMVGPWGFR
jgi:hypothetical protein